MPVNQALGSQCVTVLLISDGLGNRQTAGQSTTHDSRAKQKANCRNAATAASTRGPARTVVAPRMATMTANTNVAAITVAVRCAMKCRPTVARPN